MEIVYKKTYLFISIALLVGLGCRTEMKTPALASAPDMTILCNRRPVEADGWLPAYDGGCLDKRWLCQNASYASYLRHMVKQAPLITKAVDEEDLVVISTLQSMYAFLLLNFDCTADEILASAGNFRPSMAVLVRTMQSRRGVPNMSMDLLRQGLNPWLCQTADFINFSMYYRTQDPHFDAGIQRDIQLMRALGQRMCGVACELKKQYAGSLRQHRCTEGQVERATASQKQPKASPKVPKARRSTSGAAGK